MSDVESNNTELDSGASQPLEIEENGDKTLVDNDKGNFEDLKIDAIDPSAIEEKPTDPRFGQPKFLSWTLKKDEENGEFWEAQGKDGKIYRIVEDVIKPVKKGKIVVIDG